MRGVLIARSRLLIVAAKPTDSPQWEAVRTRPRLNVLYWDEQSDALSTTLSSLLSGRVPATSPDTAAAPV